MKTEIKVLIVKDEDGRLSPMVGIWFDDEYGKMSSKHHLDANEKDTIVRANLIEE